MNKNIFILIIIAILSLLPLHCRLSLNSYTPEPVVITNVSHRQTFKLEGNPKHKNAWNIHLKITGELNGKAKIHMAYNNGKTMYSFEIPAGKVDLDKYSDWYELSCPLTFEPIDCTAGNLKIEYNFGSD